MPEAVVTSVVSSMIIALLSWGGGQLLAWYKGTNARSKAATLAATGGITAGDRTAGAHADASQAQTPVTGTMPPHTLYTAGGPYWRLRDTILPSRFPTLANRDSIRLRLRRHRST